jgi:heat shock protein HslJ
MIFSTFFIFSQLVLISCGDKVDPNDTGEASDSSEYSFRGMDFVYQSSDSYTPVAGSTISVGFDDTSNNFYFSADCNSHSGPYEMDGDTFVVLGMSGTEMGCGNGLMEQDTWLVSFFTSSPTITHDGDILTFSNSDATLTFIDEEIAIPDQSLSGITWNIDTYIEGESASTYNVETYPTLEFNDDGIFTINTGCNGISGTYTVTGSEITTELLDMTLMACSEPIGSIETHLVQVFSDSSVTYEIDANRITISNGNYGISAFTE